MGVWLMTVFLQSTKFKHSPNKIRKQILKLLEAINFAVVMGAEIDPDLYRDIVRQLERINAELALLNHELMELDYKYQVLKAKCQKQ